MYRFALLLFALLMGALDARAANVLLVTGAASLTSDETARRTQFQTWGHTVTTIVDSDSQTNFNTAMAAVDVVYIPVTVQEWELLSKVKAATKGVVCEERYLDVEMGFSTGDGWNASHNTTEILNNSHNVTSGLPTGYVAIVSSNQPLCMMNPTIAGGMTILSKQNYGAGSMLGVMEAGGALAGGGTAAGRRVRLPWGNDSDSFSWSALNTNGLRIAQQAIQWAAAGPGPLLWWKLDESAGTTAADASGYGRNGTVTGSPSWLTARRNRGVDLPSGSKVTVSNLLGKPTSFTVAAWVDCDAVGSTGGVAVSVGDHIALIMDEPTFNAGRPAIAFNYSGSNFRWATGGTAAAGKGWRHYVGVFDDAANTLKLYIDGVLVGTTNPTESIQWAANLGTLTAVGGTSNPVASYNLDGRVDDVRVYGRALSAKEIAEIYGLVGWWKFDETSGSTAYDSSGAANHATHTGGTSQWVTGRLNNAIELDGTNRYLTVSTIADSLNGSDEFSAAVWVKADVINHDRGIFYGEASTNTDTNIGFRYDQSGASGGATRCIKASVRTTAADPQIETASEVQSLKWQHLVMTWRSGGTIKFYIDGVEQTPAYSSAASAGVLRNIATLHIGVGGYPAKWDGKLDDMRIYNRSLAADEVAKLALQGFVGHWKLNEVAGTTAVDSSPMSNNGTYTSGVSLNQPGPYYGTGAVAADFDGANDYVAIPNESLYDITGAITIAAWIKVDAFDQQFQAIISKGDGSWRLSREGNSNLLHFACTGLSSPHLTSATGVNDGAWHHIVALYNGSQMRLYIDGKLDQTLATSGSITATNDLVQIGQNSQQTNRNWEGGLFDVRLYSYALTDEAIAELYGLVGQWKLDETSGVIASDSSGKQRHGTYQGSPTLAAAGPGSGSLAASFDGVDDRVSIPTIDDKFENGVTIAGWMRPTAVKNYAKLLQIAIGTGSGIDLGRNGTSSGLRGIADPGSSFAIAGALHDNVWRHYTMTMDPSGTMRMYRNGVLLGSAARSPVPVAVRTTNWIGASNWGTDANFQGQMRDVRLYNRPISDAEATALYLGGNVFPSVRIVKWQETANP